MVGKAGAKRIATQWRIVCGIGSVLFALTTLTWLGAAEPVEACGVRCGGPHPTVKPAPRFVPPRPFQKPAQPVAPKPAVPAAKPVPTRAATARPAPTATPRRATATPAPAAPRTVAIVPAPRLAAVSGGAAPAAPTATAVPPTPSATPVSGPTQVTTAVPPISASAQVNYLVQFYSLNDSRNAPKDMKDVLLANGFHPAARPAPGVVALFLPAYFKNANGYDGMKQDGMIGIVAGIDTETATTYRLVVHTAMDAPPVEAMPAQAEDNFANVYNVPVGPYGKGQVSVFYFTR